MFYNRDIEEKSEDKTAQRQTYLLAVAFQCQAVGKGICTNCPQRLAAFSQKVRETYPRKGKKPFAASPLLKLQDSLGGFLGMAGFCHFWMPNYGLIGRPLYEKLKGKDDDPFEWNSECKGAFQELKKQLLQVSALHPPRSS